jgi:hypothetical protein
MKAVRWALLFGIIAAFLWEGGLAWYQAGRGYGSEGGSVLLKPDSYEDYVVDGENLEVWMMSGDAPYMILHPDLPVGRLHVEFLEPLAREIEVYLYYAETDSFDRYRRRDGYLLQGTKSADITIPPGDWKSLRLDIRGDFVLKKLEAWEAVPLTEISGKQIAEQIFWGRFFVLALVLSASLSLLFSEKRKAKQKSKGLRVLYYDGIRTLAAVLVIVIHVLEPLEGNYSSHSSSKFYLLFLGVMIFSYCCNQLFLMLSGALLLPYKEETISQFIQKRGVKVVLPLLIYSFFYVKLPCFSNVSLGEWAVCYLRAVFTGQMRMGPHLWLVYEMISLYLLVIPFRALLNNASKKTEKQLACLILLFFGIHTLSYCFGVGVGVSSFLGSWTGVFFMGYFLTREWMRRYDRVWMIGGALALGFSIFLAVGRSDYKQIVFGPSVLGLLMASGIFVTMMHMEKWLGRLEKILSFCSRYSYSVLLIHWYVLYHLVLSTGLCSGMSVKKVAVFSIPVCIGISLILSMVINHTWVAVFEKTLANTLFDSK